MRCVAVLPNDMLTNLVNLTNQTGDAVIELSRKQIHVVRSTVRQALGITSARRAPVVTFQASSDAVLIRAANDQVAVECRIPGPQRPTCFSLPYEALVTCEGRQADVVRIELADEQATLHWSDAGIPQSAQYATSEPVLMSAPSGEFTLIDPQFLPAMADACDTAASDSTRHAVNCVQLRGADGQLAATDGHQALLQSGFRFPWDDEVLIPASAVFALKSIRTARDVSIGRSNDWLFVRANNWTIALKIEKTGRFPAIDAHVPEVGAAGTTLALSDEDAEFFVRAAKRMPGSEEANAPLTLDLNGAAVVRVKSDDQASPTELVLSNSRRIGAELKVSTDRKFVERALQLGFRAIHLRDAETPAVCRDDRRSYFWALLGKDSVLKSDATATRIESPLRQPVSMTSPKARIPMKPHPIPQTEKKQAAGQPPSILAQAEVLQGTLRAALNGTRELIAAIKQRRKQNRLVESTLRSLKELETIAA